MSPQVAIPFNAFVGSVPAYGVSARRGRRDQALSQALVP